MFKSWRGLYERWLAINKRSLPAEDSVGVNRVIFNAYIVCYRSIFDNSSFSYSNNAKDFIYAT